MSEIEKKYAEIKDVLKILFVNPTAYTEDIIHFYIERAKKLAEEE